MKAWLVAIWVATVLVAFGLGTLRWTEQPRSIERAAPPNELIAALSHALADSNPLTRTVLLADSLDRLDLPNLAELRIDPFSGRDFVYRSTDAGFRLYSFGDNFQDDGGRHAFWKKEGDVVFWPVQKE